MADALIHLGEMRFPPLIIDNCINDLCYHIYRLVTRKRVVMTPRHAESVSFYDRLTRSS